MIIQWLNNLNNARKEVYFANSYYFITVFSSILIYSFNTLIHNYKLIIESPSLNLFYLLIVGFYSTTSISAFIFLIIISLLSGVVISMSIFLIKRQISAGYAGSSGLIVGIVAPACPSCALGIFGILGLGGFLTVLPFKGKELGVLGIVLLIYSIIYLSKKIVTNTCKI